MVTYFWQGFAGFNIYPSYLLSVRRKRYRVTDSEVGVGEDDTSVGDQLPERRSALPARVVEEAVGHGRLPEMQVEVTAQGQGRSNVNVLQALPKVEAVRVLHLVVHLEGRVIWKS